jgi:dihydropyrimidinase
MDEELQDIDLVVKGGVIVNANGLTSGDIFIKEGVIKKIGGAIYPPSTEIINASGQFILPGIIDSHVHPHYADDFGSLSLSAAFGGVTTLIPFIRKKKGTNLVESLKYFQEEGLSKSYLDFGLHGELTSDDRFPALIPECVKLGVTSFKMFMAYPKRGLMFRDDELIASMEIISDHGSLAMVHPENGFAIDYLEEKFISRGNTSPKFFSKTRPNLLEAEAVYRAIALSKVTDCPLYLVHLSAKESIGPLRLLKDERIYAETCPQYLTLTDREMFTRGPMAKIAPPLREKEDVEVLWRAVAEGLIDAIGSDHAPYTPELKGSPEGNIFEVPFGAPGVETSLPVLYDEGVNKGRINICRLVEVMSEKPAKIFGLYPKKGTIQVGSDADIVIFDPALNWTIKAENQHSKSYYSLFEGRPCLGRCITIIQRGRVVIKDLELKAKCGSAQYLEGGRFVK